MPAMSEKIRQTDTSKLLDEVEVTHDFFKSLGVKVPETDGLCKEYADRIRATIKANKAQFDERIDAMTV